MRSAEYENCKEEPRPTNRRPGNQEKDASGDLSDAQHHPHESGHVGGGEIVNRARHHEQNGFNQNDQSQSPTQTSQTKFGL